MLTPAKRVTRTALSAAVVPVFIILHPTTK